MSEPLPEPQDPVFLHQQIAYAVSLLEVDPPEVSSLDLLALHMMAHWDKKEETCERCLSAWKELPLSLRMDIRNNYELENEEQD